MSNRKLHLVRHGPVSADWTVESSEWDLAPGAASGIRKISDELAGCGLRRIVASPQRKAVATARILAGALNLDVQVRKGLEEHHRLKQQQSRSKERFRSNMQNFFAQPDDVVFGSESAMGALSRFHRAVSDIMSESDIDEVIVTHGTVISLFVASAGSDRAEDIWNSLAMPDHLIVDWPDLALCRREP